jgi:hypothetical protein
VRGGVFGDNTNHMDDKGNNSNHKDHKVETEVKKGNTISL